MPTLVLPNSATIRNIRHFLEMNDAFTDDGTQAVLQSKDLSWTHAKPIALAMASAWGAFWRREGKQIQSKMGTQATAYAARMKVFEHLALKDAPRVVEHEAAGRFLPVRQVSLRSQIGGVIGDISALLHLENEPESLAAVQYCVSELLRNVLEHSNSPDGAFVCANRYSKKEPRRVTIAVADCGQGIASHLGQVYPEALDNDALALGLAMRPGIIGALPGIYGTSNNAGAGLFFTRCIAKGTGGYFAIASGKGLYRLKRTPSDDEMLLLHTEPFDEEYFNRWLMPNPWQGTVVSVEICTDRVADYQGLFQWIAEKIPPRLPKTKRIRFT